MYLLFTEGYLSSCPEAPFRQELCDEAKRIVTLLAQHPVGARDRIVECYALLEQATPSVLHTLNRAVAVAEHLGPAEGLALLDRVDAPPWLERSHLWHGVRAYLHARCGQLELARHHAKAALEAAPSKWIAETLERRLTPLISGPS